MEDAMNHMAASANKAIAKRDEQIMAQQELLESMGETNRQLSKCLLVANDAFVWLLGYTDFPARKEGDGTYYWRSILRKRLADAGFNISLPNPPQS